MNGQQKLADYIQRYCTLTESEVVNFIDAFEETKVKKRQFIVQPNFTAHYRHFVIQGAFRAYVIDDDGTENTIAKMNGLPIVPVILTNNLLLCLSLHLKTVLHFV